MTRWRTAARRPPLPLLLGAGVAVCVAVLPVVYLLVRASDLPGDEVAELLLDGRLWSWTGRSAVLLGALAGTCLVAGSLIAWLLVATDLPGRRWLLVASAVPLAVPSYVASFGWLSLVPQLQGFWPSWAVLSAACTPYVVLPVASALASADARLVEVARSVGHGPVRAWLRGLVPQFAPAALAGALLAGLYALSDFGTPSLFRFAVLTFAVEREYTSLVGRERAALVALVLVGLALALVLVEGLLRGRAGRWSTASGSARRPARVRLGPAAVPALALVLLPVLVAVVVPVAALFRRLAIGTRRQLVWPELLEAVATTAYVALLGGVLALALAACVGLLSARWETPGVRVLEALSFAGHVLPGIVVGLALAFFSLRVVPGLYQTVAVLVLAYGVLLMPKAVGAVRTSVGQVPPVLSEVSASLGRGRLARHGVTARLASPGVLAGFLLVVVTAMKELPATLLLRPSGTDTLATEMWSRSASAADGAAAPYALALVLLAAVPAVLLSRVGAR